mmetsp:Transcript_67592/g.108244  ORF Transcript_67592/g.108244 Transcript_67592/m.108244 type:complete len:96 (+) Transcript_67592:3-290(+)
MQLLEKEAALNRSELENKMLLMRERAISDAKQYEAKTFQAQLTPEFLQHTLIQAFAQSLGNNTKFFFGEKIPSSFLNFASAATGDMASFKFMENL